VGSKVLLTFKITRISNNGGELFNLVENRHFVINVKKRCLKVVGDKFLESLSAAGLGNFTVRLPYGIFSILFNAR
jgi:hypothetical protein